jgi:hypothetical protein
MFQCLSFYQKEMALWLGHHLDASADGTCLDTEMSPVFKVGACVFACAWLCCGGWSLARGREGAGEGGRGGG